MNVGVHEISCRQFFISMLIQLSWMRVRATVARLNSLCKDMSVGSELQQTLRQRVKRTKRLTKETNVKAEPITTPPQPLSLLSSSLSFALFLYTHTHIQKHAPTDTHPSSLTSTRSSRLPFLQFSSLYLSFWQCRYSESSIVKALSEGWSFSLYRVINCQSEHHTAYFVFSQCYSL